MASQVQGVYGNQTIITQGGDDSLTVRDSIKDNAIVNLGDGNNVIKVDNSIYGSAQVMTGSGNDTFNICYVVSNDAKLSTGAGVDTVNIHHSIRQNAVVETADGKDTVNVGEMVHSSKIITGNGDDKVAIKKDVSDNAMIDTSGVVAAAIPGTPGSPAIPGTLPLYGTRPDGTLYLIAPGKPGTPAVPATPGTPAKTDNDVIKIDKSVTDNARVKTGDGDDCVTICGNVAKSAEVDTGTGADKVCITSMTDQARVLLGANDDCLTVKHLLGNAHADGGQGTDTLVINGGANRYFGSISANVDMEDVNGFEVVKLEYNSTVDLKLSDVIRNNDDGILFIKGGSSSKVDLGANNWNSDPSFFANLNDAQGRWHHDSSKVVDGVSYHVYTHSASNDYSVYIEQGVQVI